MSQEYSPGNEVARGCTLSVWWLMIHSCAVYIVPAVYGALLFWPRVLLMTKCFFWPDGYECFLTVVFQLFVLSCRKIEYSNFTSVFFLRLPPWDPYDRVISYVEWSIWGDPIWVPCSLLPISGISVVHFWVALSTTEKSRSSVLLCPEHRKALCVWENFGTPSVTRKDHMWNRSKP